MLFKQFFHKESSTYTYLIACTKTNIAVLIDPVNTDVDDYVALLKEQDLTLKYALDTHVHADHVTATGLLKEELGCQTGVSALCGANNPDIHILDGDVFELSEYESIKTISTPGHTAGSVCFLWRGRLFTGDTLLISGCGRTDFQGGDSATQYDSITQLLFTLSDDTLVYPGHDYNGKFVSNIAQERLGNPRLANKSKDEFVEIMDNLNLPYPKLIDIAVPANRDCGLVVQSA
ncbi:MAG: sulfur dioxygenase [Methylophagaceae bacterium]|jgi:sulfur dioxygenase